MKLQFKLLTIISVIILAGCSQSRNEQQIANSKTTHELRVSLQSIEHERYNQVRVLFFNDHSTETIRLLKPLDGSLYGWLMPHYDFRVKNANGDELPLDGRCGVFGHPYSGTKWPEDYLIEIEPKQSQELLVYLPHKVMRPGEYLVSLKYIFTPDEGVETPGGPYPERLSRGIAESDGIHMKLK